MSEKQLKTDTRFFQSKHEKYRKGCRLLTRLVCPKTALLETFEAILRHRFGAIKLLSDPNRPLRTLSKITQKQLFSISVILAILGTSIFNDSLDSDPDRHRSDLSKTLLF